MKYCPLNHLLPTIKYYVVECEQFIVDLVFVVDSSGSIRDNNPADGSFDNWALILQYVYDVVDFLDIGENANRIGLVAYSQNAVNIFYLNE